MIRVRAGISYALAEAMDEGHCGLPADELAALTAKLIEVPPALIETALALELEAGEVVADTVGGPALRVPRRALPGRAGDRRAAARPRRRRARPGRRSMPARRSPGSSAGPGWRLAREPASRRCAWRFASKVLVITGGPGVGKTTLVNSILQDPPREAGRGRALRADRPGRQAPVREHRARGQDHPSAAGDRPEDRRFQARRGAPARLRPAGGRRGQHGRRAADALAAAGAAGPGGAAARRRCRPAAVGRARARCWPTSSPPAPCRWCG